MSNVLPGEIIIVFQFVNTMNSGDSRMPPHPTRGSSDVFYKKGTATIVINSD